MGAGILAAYAILYWGHVASTDLEALAKISYFAGSCSVICMVAGLALSARPRAVESWFGGLDRMYRLHKHLGVAALLLFMAHFATVLAGPDEEAAIEAVAGNEEGGLPIDLVGLLAMVGFTLLIIVTLNRKIPYHRWLTTHRFMGLFFFAVRVHVALVLYEGEELAFLSDLDDGASRMRMEGRRPESTGQLPPAGTDAAGVPCRSNRMMPACWRAALKPECGGKPAGDALRYPLERRG